MPQAFGPFSFGKGVERESKSDNAASRTAVG